MSLVALSELLGATVRDPSGSARGRVREIAVSPQEHATRVAYVIVRTPQGERALAAGDLKSCGATVRTTSDAESWPQYSATDGVLTSSGVRHHTFVSASSWGAVARRRLVMT